MCIFFFTLMANGGILFVLHPVATATGEALFPHTEQRNRTMSEIKNKAALLVLLGAEQASNTIVCLARTAIINVNQCGDYVSNIAINVDGTMHDLNDAKTAQKMALLLVDAAKAKLERDIQKLEQGTEQ